MTVEQQAHRIRVNGVDLSYVEEGKGQSVVFVHGYFGDYRSWRPQIGFFARRYRTIAYSLRYNYPNKGRADRSDRAQEAHTNDLGGLIEELELKPAHVVGSSYGGVIALRLARWRPKLARTLVLGEPGLLSWLREIPGGASLLNDFETRFADPAKKSAREGAVDKALRLVTDGAVGPGIYDNLPEASRQAFMDNAHLIESYDFNDMFSREDAKTIRTPLCS